MKRPEDQDCQEDVLAAFDTPDVEEDERVWQAKFDATPDEKFDRLVDKVRADIRAGKVQPLNFTNG